jgi:hypothetical protein
MIETRPRSSAAAWRMTPTICATRPSNQTHWVRSLRTDPGCRADTPVRLSAAFLPERRGECEADGREESQPRGYRMHKRPRRLAE